MKKAVLGLFVLLLLMVLTVAAMLWREARTFLDASPQPPGQGREVLFRVTPGMGFAEAATTLEREGVVTDGWRFQWYIRISSRVDGTLGGTRPTLKARELSMRTDWTPERVLRELLEGKAVLWRLQVPEGLTIWQTARLVEAAGLADAGAFEAVARDREFLARHGLSAESAEGFLFPDTYMLTRPENRDPRPVVEAMLKEFFARVDPLFAKRPPFEELRRIVTLASIVEKETGAASERARVAGVYAARLERRMLLQADPTTIYGLGPAFDGNLRRRDLEDEKNPYNTYRHPGLPPGPICSPGLEAIKAALNPERHEYLYFVATGDGGHQFSRTLDEHNRAVRKYQLGR